MHARVYVFFIGYDMSIKVFLVFLGIIMHTLFFYTSLLVICINSYSQNKSIDSLYTILKNQKEDTNKVNTLYALSYDLETIGNYSEGLKNGNKGIELAIKLGFQKGLSKCYHINGVIYFDQLNTPKALEYYTKSLKIDEDLGDKSGISICCDNIALIYMNQSNYPKALEYYTKSLKIKEELGDKSGTSTCCNGIGIIYDYQSNYPKALEYYTKSLKIKEELGNKSGISNCYVNIGNIYMNQNNDPKALGYYIKALNIDEELGDKKGISICYSNIGIIYKKQKNYPKALEYYTKSLKIKEELGNKSGIALVLVNISGLNNELKKHLLAKKQAEQAISISKEIGKINNLSWAFEELAKAEEGLGNYKAAYINHKKFKELNDSIFNIENSKQLSDIKTNYEVEKKQTELKAKAETQELINNEEKKRQQYLIYVVTGILLIVIVFSALLFKRFRLTNKQKKIIEIKEKETQQQNEIIKVQKHLVEEKHREITDSINYAERIQRSFLATKEQLDEKLKEYFVLFQPKDVVSGDFYWAHTLQNGNFALVTADSTGHGVPGAIMSLLNTSSLERAVELGISEPAEILNHTRQTIIERLKKDGSAEGGKDGMDCSLISFNKEKSKFVYAAANNPIWIIRNKELIELTPDKIPVGKHDRDSISFAQQEVEIQKGDMIYTLTDGFPDQFGGPKGKKFMYKKLKELLISIAHKSVKEQKTELKVILKNWMGNIEQVDDVTIIGIRV
jgi:serine phosphatase RsbU (regulator of sigma subunit)